MGYWSKISSLLKEKRRINIIIAAIIACIFIASCIPVVYVGLFNYATGDDLLYGSVVKRAITEKASLLDILKLVALDVKNEYYSFQGTWSSQFLWRFEPSVFGEKWYVVTVFIALFSLIIGTYYFMEVLFVDSGLCDKVTMLSIVCLLLLFSIQYMPYPRGGIYWFTGMTHYTFPYGLVLFGIGLAVNYIRSGRKKFLIGTLLIGVYIGGSGYPSIVICGIGLLYCIVTFALNGDANQKKRALILIVPEVLLIIGFVISAMAPGNDVRGGEDYYFSLNRVVFVIYKCIYEGILGGIKYFIIVRPLFLLPIGAFLFSLPFSEKIAISNKRIFIVFLLGLFLVCMVRSPEIYAGDTVVAGISGGVYDTYFYVTLLYIVIVSMLLGIKVGNRIDDSLFNKVKIGYIVVALMFCALFCKHLIGNSLIYNCYNYITLGHLSDYKAQMDERIRILNSTDDVEVVLPFINDEQGPLMHMPVTTDISNYTNYVTAKFYGKKSVIGMDRKTWELMK